MFRYLFSVISLLFVIISPCVANIASSGYVDEMRNNVQAKIDKKANNANYAQNMVLQTDGSGNVVATTVGTDLFADGSIETMHLADGAVTNADLAGMIDITKLNLGTLPTSGKHMMIWNAETQKYVFERYATSILPDGYTQLEYIESTGTQYIDTGYKPIAHKSGYLWDGIFYDDLSGTRTISAVYKTFLSGNFSFGMSGNYGNNLGGHQKGWNATHYSGKSINVGERSVVYIQNNDDYNGVYSTIAVSSPLYSGVERVEFPDNTKMSYNLFLFATNSAGVVKEQAHVKLYKFQLFEGSFVVRDFIPAKRNSDGAVGMYDTVTETFFTNSGTGSFIAGPEIE